METTERFSKLASWDRYSNSGDREAATGSPVFQNGPQVANLENRSVVDSFERIAKGNKIDMAM